MEKVELPIDFIHQMGDILNEIELHQFLSAIVNTSSVTGLRMNPWKGAHLKVKGTPVPWTQRGVTLENRPNFTLDPSFHAGAYYVQDPSSMLVEWIARKLLIETKTPFILDLAAAPGGKSTLLAEIASEKEGFLLANEVIKSRVPILKQNLAKWGYSNVFISSFEVSVFNAMPPLFDLVLLDAPCSGEGLFRKDIHARSEWSLDHVNHCASRQKRILSSIPGLLKEGGYLLYSTCTYNPKENDDQVTWLCQQFPLKIVPFDIPSTWGILKTEQGGFQCYPHRVNGEGFYLAVLQLTGENEPIPPEKNLKKPPRIKISFPDSISKFIKKNSDLIGIQDHSGNYYGIPEALFPAFNILSQFLPFIDPVLLLGNAKGKDFIPEADLALSSYLNPDLPILDLDRFDALVYLKKEISPIHPPHSGWGLIRYDGLFLGWYKGIGERYNNYHPKQWRILMPIPDRANLPELPINRS